MRVGMRGKKDEEQARLVRRQEGQVGIAGRT